MTTSPNIIVIMGVSGAGKTAVGRALADAVGWKFLEGDDFHSAANVEKMKHAIPLTDDDRAPWLASLRDAIADVARQQGHAILACSALKHAYRDVLRSGGPAGAVQFVHLDVPKDVLAERMAQRHHRYMPPELLQSQLDTLETPRDAFWVDGTLAIPEIVRRLIEHFHLQPAAAT